MDDNLCRKVYRVWKWNPATLRWAMADEHDKLIDAVHQAANLRKAGSRARVLPATRKVATIKPPVNSETRRHRQAAGYKMSDLADAKKYYKSPG